MSERDNTPKQDMSEWENRWNEGRTGFHQRNVTPYLSEHFLKLADRKNTHGLLPLCGKTYDLKWIADRGHKVTGVEYVQKAIDEFFQDHAITNPKKTNAGTLSMYQANGISLIQGDFFEAKPENLEPVDWVFDRAAWIALPASHHQKYAEHLAGFLKPGGKVLLISLEHDEGAFDGPPHSLSKKKIEAHANSLFDIEELGHLDVTKETDHLTEKGLKWIHEAVYLLTKKG